MKNLAIVFFVLMLLCASVAAQTTEFTYQGSLKNTGAPANGNFDFEFLLFDQLSGGSQVGSTLTQSGVSVANGIFSVKLDFGVSYPGADRFLEIHVQQAGGGFTALTPRQRVSSAPYAVKSINADNATNALQLGGVAANQYVVTTDPRMRDDRTPTAGSGNYIQSNPASTQTGANFNINGFGTANEFDALTFKGGEYWSNGSPIVQTRGTGNLFVGKDVDFAGAGSNNSIFGQGAGQQNTGDFNSFFGYATGATNAGSFNSSFGVYAGGGMTSTANSNSFFGDRAGEFNSSGSGNTYIGSNGTGSGGGAGDNNTMLGANTFLGTNTSNNTNLGAYASVVGNGSSNNTILGYNSGIPSSASISNSTVIGTFTYVSTSNTIIFGHDTVGTLPMTTTQVRGKFQMLSPANGAAVAGSFELNGLKGLIADHLVFRNLDIPISPVHLCYRVEPTGGSDGGYGLTGCGALLTSVRNKSDIQPFAGGLDVIKRLRPVTFKWKATGASDAGLNVEDVAEVDPSLVSRDDKGKILDVKENRLNVLFINAFQERQAQIEQQQRQIERQQIQIENLKKMMCLDHKEADVCQKK